MESIWFMSTYTPTMGCVQSCNRMLYINQYIFFHIEDIRWDNILIGDIAYLKEEY